MKTLIITLAVLSSLLATENNPILFVDYTFNNTNNNSLSFAKIDISNTTKIDDENILNYNLVYSRISTNSFIDQGTGDYPPKDSLYTTTAYYTHHFGDNSINIGLIPFKNGSYSDVNYNITQRGDGLYNIVNVSAYSIMMTTKINNTMYKYGAMLYNNEFLNIEHDQVKQNNNSIFLTFLTDTNIDSKNNITTNAFYGKPKYNDEEVADMFLTAIGYKWDDKDDTGLIIYTIISASYINENISNPIRDDIITKYNIPEQMVASGKSSGFGYSTLFAIQKSFETYYPTSITYETQHNSDEYYNLSGSMFNYERFGGWVGDFQSINFSIKPKPNLKISAKLTEMTSSKTKQPGSLINTMVNPQHSNSFCLTIRWMY